MSITTATFRINGDNRTNGMFSEIRRNVSGLKNEIGTELAGKLKSLIAPIAIEESIRRTAEWANEIKQASTEIGTSAEEIQALRLAAKRAHVDQNTVINLYKQMANAAKEAVNGNVAVRASLKNLGISDAQINGASGAKMFDAMSMKVGNNPNAYANDLNKIFGEEEIPALGAIFGQIDGKGMSKYASDNSNNIVPNADIESMSAAWTGVLETSKRIAIKLAGLAKVVLMIVDGLLKMVSGLFTLALDMIKSPFEFGKAAGNAIKSRSTEPINDFFKLWIARNKSMGKGALEMIPGVNFKKGTPYLTSEQDADYRQAGAGIATIAGGEALGAVKGVRAFQGAIKEATRNAFIKYFKGKPVFEDFSNAYNAAREAGGAKFDHEAWTAKYLQSAQGKNLATAIKSSNIAVGLSELAIPALLTATAGGEYSMLHSGNGNAAKKIAINRLMNIDPSSIGGGGGFGGGSGGNLKIGGVFGADVSMRIMQLNQEMVMLLRQIVTNTGVVPGSVNTSILMQNP